MHSSLFNSQLEFWLFLEVWLYFFVYFFVFLSKIHKNTHALKTHKKIHRDIIIIIGTFFLLTSTLPPTDGRQYKDNGSNRLRFNSIIFTYINNKQQHNAQCAMRHNANQHIVTSMRLLLSKLSSMCHKTPCLPPGGWGMAAW